MITLRRTIPFAMLTTALGAAWIAGCNDQKTVDTAPQPSASATATQPLPPPPPPTPQVTACDAVQTPALTSMLQARAATDAPGMQPEGATVCNVVPEGQSASSQVFMLQQGFCYTILGASLPGVTELDMQLDLDLAGGGAVPPALAALNIKPLLMTDTEQGPNGAMGAKQSCYQWAFPIPAAVRVTLKSRTGAGPVAAQVYKKKKF
jgi:hypothetical protein